MRTKQNTLLMGVAALALLAGTEFALAQQSPQGQKSAPSTSEQSGMPAQSAKPAAGAGMEQHAQTGATTGDRMGDKAGDSAALNAKGQANQPSTHPSTRPSMAQQGAATTAKPENRDAQIKKTGPSANMTAQTREQRKPEQLGAKMGGEHDRSSAENDRNGNLKGLQGNASVPMQGNITLNEHQKTKIRDRVIDARGAPRVGHVDFNVTVGTVVPRNNVEVVPVPETLVRIEPRWHGYLYFVYEDEIVIVNPHDMRIVAVVTV